MNDLATDLVWESISPATSALTWAAAENYCTGGWRLPSVHELLSIVDYGVHLPAGDREAFPHTPSGLYWTSTRHFLFPGRIWVVDFRSGSTSTIAESSPTAHFVRCVQGQDNFDENNDRLREGNHGEVLDSTTSRMWAFTAVTEPWVQGLNYCHTLDHGGHIDWRLPTIKELASLVDFGRAFPAAVDEISHLMANKRYWSSTTAAQQSFKTGAWTVNMVDGTVSPWAKSDLASIVCVRHDLEPPTPLSITGISSTPSTGILSSGDQATFEILFSEPVISNEPLTLTIQMGEITRQTEPVTIPFPTDSVIFSYDVVDGDHEGSGIIVPISQPGLQALAGSFNTQLEEPTQDTILSNLRVAGRTCKTILDSGAGTATGQYLIDPDGGGGHNPHWAWCNMDIDGGGWTLVWKFTRNSFSRRDISWLDNANIASSGDCSMANLTACSGNLKGRPFTDWATQTLAVNMETLEYSIRSWSPNDFNIPDTINWHATNSIAFWWKGSNHVVVNTEACYIRTAPGSTWDDHCSCASCLDAHHWRATYLR